MRKVLAAIGIAGLVAAAVGMALLTTYESPLTVYSGVVTFNSTQEFTEFWNYISDPQIDIRDADVLSFEPLIRIQYRVIVPRDTDFPYAYDRQEPGATGTEAGYYMMIGFGFAAALVLGGIAAFGDWGEEKG